MSQPSPLSFPRIPLIAFDLDGTLVDTECMTLPDIVEHLNTGYGFPLTLELWYKNYHGMAGHPMLERLAKDFGIYIPPERFFRERQQHIERLFANGIDPAPGMLQVIRQLAAAGQKMCICSNSPPERVHLTLKNIKGQHSAGISLEEIFGRHVISAQEPGRPPMGAKPSPEVYLATAAHYGVKPQECLAVEDTITGITSATGAGFTTWGYTGILKDPVGQQTRLKKGGAAKTFVHWDDFLPLLSTFTPKAA